MSRSKNTRKSGKNRSDSQVAKITDRAHRPEPQSTIPKSALNSCPSKTKTAQKPLAKTTAIFAPAGGAQQLTAAIDAGADAVYFGVRAFNARRRAQNFTSVAPVVRQCHDAGVQAILTLNVLVRDDEWPDLLALLEEAACAGVDGVIVQDLGVAHYIRRHYPSLPLHASTQMTVHNRAGLRLLEDMGFIQAVLARELTLGEIRLMARETALRLEVFVHGALCMSVSGACYFSGMLGERSGNRGCCAQTCRLPFQSKSRAFALSLKDMSHIRHIPQLIDAGADVLKIEGRMKSPAYVHAAVTACRDVMAGDTPDLASLQNAFSRSGFTDGYLHGKRSLSMFGRRTEQDVRSSRAFSRSPSATGRKTAATKSPLPTVVYPKETPKADPDPTRTFPDRSATPRLWARFSHPKQVPYDLSCDLLILPLHTLSSGRHPVTARPIPLAAEMPPLMFPSQEDETRRTLHQLKDQGVTQVLLHNLGSLAMARDLGFTLHGGYGLNLINSTACQWCAQQGLQSATVSFELLFPKAQRLLSPLPLGLILYGHLPLMQLRACPAQTEKGCGACTGSAVLTDRKGARFPLLCHRRQFSTLHHNLPVYIGDFPLTGFSHGLFYFTTESLQQCHDRLTAYTAGSPPDFSYTRGAYRRKLL